jgi:serine/threonine-protein kinase
MEYIQKNYEKKQQGTITDKTTGLTWQQSGCAYPLTWHQTRKYVEGLNKEKFAGSDCWRLPTIDELISLLTPTPHGEDFCIEPLFDRNQKWLWSSDLRSFMAAWYVNVELGFVAWHDFSGFYYAKAVCTAGA